MPLLTIAFATRTGPMNGRRPWERSLGGSESAMVFAARARAARGHTVDVYTMCGTTAVGSGFTGGSVKIRIGYRNLMSIENAP